MGKMSTWWIWSLVYFHSLLIPRRLLSETWKYTSFPQALARFACSLIIMMNVSKTARLKLDVIVLPPPPPPLIFGGNHILVIFAPNMHQKLYLGVVGVSKCKLSLPWEGGTPTWSLRSLAVILADYFRRHGNIGHFQRRSLIIMMNISETACMLNVIVFFRHTVVYIIVPY